MVKTRDLHQIIQTTGEIIAEDIQGIQPPWIREGATETNIEISNEDQIINNNDVIRVTNEDVNRDDNRRTTQSIGQEVGMGALFLLPHGALCAVIYRF